MNVTKRELANSLDNASAKIVSIGESRAKAEVAALLDADLLNLHKECALHIHDLEFYSLSYNCLGISAKDYISGQPCFRDALLQVFAGVVELTNQQSGGIGFMDFDQDMADYVTDESDAELEAALTNFYTMLNLPLRKGCEKAYVTLNFGLCTSPQGRRVSQALLQAYSAGQYIFPNLVFKLQQQVNRSKGAPNYDLYQRACQVSATCMNPTYYNADASYNRHMDAHRIGVMGCRTRMGGNLHGQDGSIHRGNLACLTLNLVQLALKHQGDWQGFYQALDQLLDQSRDILLQRWQALLNEAKVDHLFARDLYEGSSTGDREQMLRNGSLSIGFIGLWDALLVMHHREHLELEQVDALQQEGLSLVGHLRQVVDGYGQATGLNFSLLGSSGEGVSGRFPQYDLAHFVNATAVAGKGYYTNSFHLPVDAPLSCFEKLQLEAPFHALCNGGHISYVELAEVPLGNGQAVQDLVDFAAEQDMGYFGINYPLDYCCHCHTKGTFDQCCPHCGSKQIKRLRRVSGYLSEKDLFTKGKQAELAARRTHQVIMALEDLEKEESEMHISIEGVDGVGKTTAAQLVAEKLGYQFVEKPVHELWAEDGMDKYMELTQKLNDQGDPNTRALFYSFSNLYFSQKYAEQDVVTDRYFSSNCVWNGDEQNQPLFDFLAQHIRVPELTILLTASKETMLQRIKGRNSQDPDLAKVDDNLLRQEEMAAALEKYNFPHIILPTDKLSKEEVCQYILDYLGHGLKAA